MERLRGGGVGAVLVRGAGIFLLLQLAGIALNLGLHVLLARQLGVESYGVFVYVLGWLNVLAIVGRLGFGTSSLRYVSALLGSGDWERLRGFLRVQRAAVTAGSAAVAAATAVGVGVLSARLPGDLAATFWIACAALLPFALLGVSSPALRALRRVTLSQLTGSVLQPALLLAAVGAVFLLGSGRLDAPATMALFGLTALLTAAASSWALRRSLPEALAAAAPRTDAREWLRVSAWLMLIGLLNVVMQRADLLVIGSLRGPAEAGLYAPARRIATLIGFGLVAVNAWAAPLIADLHARGDRARLARLTRRAAQIVFAITAPATVAVVLGGRPLLGLFGPEFPQAYAALVVLVGGQLVNALAGPVGFLMTMTGHQTRAAQILAASALLDVGLLFVLVPTYGLLGAAAASAAAQTAWNGAMAWAVWRRLRVRATIL